MGALGWEILMEERRRGLATREREVVRAFAADPEGSQVDAISIRRLLVDVFAEQRSLMREGNLSGIAELFGGSYAFSLQRYSDPTTHSYGFSFGPEAWVVWAHSDNDLEVVVRVDAILEAHARSFAGAMRERKQHNAVTITEYLILARCEDDWEIRDRVSETDGRHYQTDELPGSAAEFARLHDEATIDLATDDAGREIPTVQLSHIDGGARARLLDLSNVDGRFSPDVIGASVGNILRAWEMATRTDLPDDRLEQYRAALRALTTSGAFDDLTHPTPFGQRHVIALEVHELQLRSVVPDREPPTIIIRMTLHGMSWIRGMWDVTHGNDAHPHTFHAEWTLELTTDTEIPWHVNAVADPLKA
ncbi:MAG: hypothetical protein ACLP01_13100 [Solirubrobacteraceae bacterium]